MRASTVERIKQREMERDDVATLINSFNNDILINFKFVHTNKMTQIF